jgi:hypothetical protein
MDCLAGPILLLVRSASLLGSSVHTGAEDV